MARNQRTDGESHLTGDHSNWNPSNGSSAICCFMFIPYAPHMMYLHVFTSSWVTLGATWDHHLESIFAGARIGKKETPWLEWWNCTSTSATKLPRVPVTPPMLHPALGGSMTIDTTATSHQQKSEIDKGEGQGSRLTRRGRRRNQLYRDGDSQLYLLVCNPYRNWSICVSLRIIHHAYYNSKPFNS